MTRSVNPRGLIRTLPGWTDNVQAFHTGGNVAGNKKPIFAAFTGGIGAYSFTHTSEPEIHLVYHIEHDYMPGTNVFPHVHWAPSDTSAGVVRWGIEWTHAKGHGQEAFTESQTIYVEEAAGRQALFHQVTETAYPGIYIEGLEADSIVLIRIFRNSNHANDTYAAPVFGLAADLHYQVSQVATIGKTPDFFVAD